MSKCFDIIEQFKTHIFPMKQGRVYHICCHGNRCAIRTTHILQSRYAVCNACYIKRSVHLCLLHSLYNGIDVEIQEPHKIS